MAKTYPWQHRQLRATLQRTVDAGNGRCWRPECGKRIPAGSAAWHLGHRDDGSYGGIECIPCNLRNAAGKTNAKRRASGSTGRPAARPAPPGAGFWQWDGAAHRWSRVSRAWLDDVVEVKP